VRSHLASLQPASQTGTACITNHSATTQTSKHAFAMLGNPYPVTIAPWCRDGSYPPSEPCAALPAKNAHPSNRSSTVPLFPTTAAVDKSRYFPIYQQRAKHNGTSSHQTRLCDSETHASIVILELSQCEMDDTSLLYSHTHMLNVAVHRMLVMATRMFPLFRPLTTASDANLF